MQALVQDSTRMDRRPQEIIVKMHGLYDNLRREEWHWR